MIRAFNALALVGMAIGLFWMSAPPAFSADPASVPEGMVATVNGVGISRADFLQVYHALRNRVQTRVGALERRELEREALNNLIRRAVALDECQKQGIQADPQAVSNEIAVMQSRFANVAAFASELRSDGLTLDRLRREVAKDLAIRRLIDLMVLPSVSVSEDAIKAFYYGNPMYFQHPDQLHTREIAIRVAPDADAAARNAARDRLIEIKHRIENGETFDAMARLYSEDGMAKNGGDLGFVDRDKLAKPYAEVASNLAPGQVSDPVRLSDGYHLIQLVAKADAHTVSYDSVHDLLLVTLKRRKTDLAIRAYLDELRQHDDVRIALH